MSYLERLNGIKSAILDKNQNDQSISDQISQGAAELLQRKVEHLNSTLESVGVGGLGIMKGTTKVKDLYNKWRGKKDKPKEEEEDGEEEAKPTADEPPVQPEEMPEATGGEAPSVAGADAEANVVSRATTEITFDTADPFETTFTRGLGDMTFTSTRAYTGEGFEEGSLDRPVEVNLNPAPQVEDTEVPPEASVNTSSTVEQMTLETNEASTGGGTQLSTSQGLSQTATQDTIQNLNGDVEDTFNSLSNTVSDTLSNVGNTLSNTVTDVIDPLASSVSSFADIGLAIGDAVLDAIPVVGEVALVATAVAGFFEAIFGNQDKTPDQEITGKEGLDADALVSAQQTPATEQV